MSAQPTSSSQIAPPARTFTGFTPRKSSPRLADFDYLGPYAYFVTLNADGNRPNFRGQFAQRTVDLLLTTAANAKFEVMAYCVTPDHIHLLAIGLDETSDLKKFMQRFKQLTGFQFKRSTGTQLWHRSYYDHVLRDEDDMKEIAAYIWLNPVAGGLVSDSSDYLFSGPPDRLGGLSDRAEALSLRDDAVRRWDESHNAR